MRKDADREEPAWLGVGSAGGEGVQRTQERALRGCPWELHRSTKGENDIYNWELKSRPPSYRDGWGVYSAVRGGKEPASRKRYSVHFGGCFNGEISEAS